MYVRMYNKSIHGASTVDVKAPAPRYREVKELPRLKRQYNVASLATSSSCVTQGESGDSAVLCVGMYFVTEFRCTGGDLDCSSGECTN